MAQIHANEEALYLIEKILIQLLGYQDILVRDQAVVLLNMLYDGVDWQMQSAFRPVVRCVGQHFKIEFTLRYDNFNKARDSIFLGLSAPGVLSTTHDCILTWHKIAPRNLVEINELGVRVSLNLGKFWKCGFYDWRIIIINGEGKLSTPLLTQPPTTHSFPITRSRSLSAADDDFDEYDMDTPLAQGRFVVHA